jgi:hypothetical protein
MNHRIFRVLISVTLGDTVNPLLPFGTAYAMPATASHKAYY